MKRPLPRQRPAHRARRNPNVTVSDGALKFLQKVAKKTKGAVPIEEFIEVAPLFGWTVARAPLPRPGFDRVSWARATAGLEGLTRDAQPITSVHDEWSGNGVHIRATDPTVRRGGYYQKPDEHIARAASGAVVAALRETCIVLSGKKALPPLSIAPSLLGAVFLADLTAVKADYDHDGLDVTAKAWTVVDGYLVEADGKVLGAVWIEYDRRGQPTRLADKPGSVWTWAYKAGMDRLAAEVIVSLGDEATRRRRPEHPQGDDHTGICQICERRQKLSAYTTARPVLVDHGYHHENTGHGGYSSFGYLGQRTGSCFGVGHAPWELDWRRLAQYRDDKILPAIERLSDYVSRLTSGRVRSLKRFVMHYSRTKPDEWIEYTPDSTKWPSGHYNWQSLLASETGRVESELAQAIDEAKRITAKLKSWKRAPLYDELHPPTR